MALKLATYQFSDGVGPARIDGGAYVDLRPLAASVIELLEGGANALEQAAVYAGEARELERTHLLAPIPVPRAFLGIGLNYRDHAAEIGRALPDHPTVFAKLSTSVAPPFSQILAPRWTDTFDYEGELGIVMGLDAEVAGYVVVNDLTARALAQPNTLVLAKSGAGFGPFGPWITTADEVSNAHNLRISTWINGELRQLSSTAQLHHRIDDLIAFISRSIKLSAGDIITTGSPAGSGAGFRPPRWLTAGDVMKIEIEQLGYIENTIV